MSETDLPAGIRAGRSHWLTPAEKPPTRQVTQIPGRSSMVVNQVLTALCLQAKRFQVAVDKQRAWVNLMTWIPDPAALAAYTVHFAYDSAAVKKSEDANIQAVASKLSADSSTKLQIEGNCDERGTEEIQPVARLNAARWRCAKHWPRPGLTPCASRTISYGKDKPRGSCQQRSGLAIKPPRDFVLLHPKSGA